MPRATFKIGNVAKFALVFLFFEMLRIIHRETLYSPFLFTMEDISAALTQCPCTHIHIQLHSTSYQCAHLQFLPGKGFLMLIYWLIYKWIRVCYGSWAYWISQWNGTSERVSESITTSWFQLVLFADNWLKFQQHVCVMKK